MGSGYGHSWAIYLVLWVTTWVIADDPTPNFKEHFNELIPKDRPCNFLLTVQDAHLTTPQVLDRYGYSNEIHSVTTNDGFILEIHRIPSPGRPVVLLVHGLGSSSRDFVVNCERRALAFKLADGGYDVWMSNYRGNSYTTHKNLTKHGAKFWDYSFDEYAQVDTPATIDYILNETRQSQLSLVGMSLGNVIVPLMLSAKPQYNQKVNVWFAMGATLDFRKIKSNHRRLIRFHRLIARIMNKWNRGAAFNFRFLSLLHLYLPKFCASESELKDPNSICPNLWSRFDGPDPGQIPPEVMVIMVGEYPQQISIKSVVHCVQWMKKEHFAMYDYGPWNNLIHYGTLDAPRYPLEKITTSIVFFKAQNDFIAPQGTMKETMELVSSTSPHANFSIVPVNSSTWNHIDFSYGKDADILVYRYILERLGGAFQKRNTDLLHRNRDVNLKMKNTVADTGLSELEQVSNRQIKVSKKGVITLPKLASTAHDLLVGQTNGHLSEHFCCLDSRFSE